MLEKWWLGGLVEGRWLLCGRREGLVFEVFLEGCLKLKVL